jgi:hypothetical protein
MVPDGQSVKDWTDMITVQIVRGMTNVTPEASKTNRLDNSPIAI